MHATLDTLVGIIRVHEDGNEGNEITYTWSCFAVFNFAESKATLHGAVRAPNLMEAKALRRLLQSIDIRTVEWERRTGANTGIHAYNV